MIDIEQAALGPLKKNRLSRFKIARHLIRHFFNRRADDCGRLFEFSQNRFKRDRFLIVDFLKQTIVLFDQNLKPAA